MLKKWIDMVGQDYCYIYFKDLERFCRLCKKFYVKNLDVMWTMKHATPRRNIFSKDGLIYTFSIFKYLLYIYLLKSLFFTGI